MPRQLRYPLPRKSMALGRRSLPTRLAVASLALALASGSTAYESSIHQKLTFLAAKQLNRCLAGRITPPVSALQVRMIARANARQAETNVLVRMMRWNYYDRSGVGDRDILWVIDTRFHEHFDQQVSKLAAAGGDAEAFPYLGRILNYVQDVTSPAHAAPVYTTRWWRLRLKDRFDEFPIDEDRVAAAVRDSCAHVLANITNYDGVLRETAENTVTAIEAPMFGLPASWEAFWTLNEDPGKFGEYGPAGNNFGRNTRFRCGAQGRCVLLSEDPLYQEFALQRHISAVVASMRVMLILQRQRMAP
ncbi:MAG: hypothetical protein OXJ53_13410 [Gammaproteobacteria bacterium]|nr:hypothetical protein [Gammaproteobacteria bacterium]